MGVADRQEDRAMLVPVHLEFTRPLPPQRVSTIFVEGGFPRGSATVVRRIQQSRAEISCAPPRRDSTEKAMPIAAEGSRGSRRHCDHEAHAQDCCKTDPARTAVRSRDDA